MSSAPDPEPCERCGAPIMLIMDGGKPVGYMEYLCLCSAADHHWFAPCRARVPHTPERCTEQRKHPDTSWRDRRHRCLDERRAQLHPSREYARWQDEANALTWDTEIEYDLEPDGSITIRRAPRP